MSGYLKSVVLVENFDGDTVTVRMRPLQLDALLRIRSAAATGGDDAVATVFQTVLPEHVESVEGLRTADGAALTIEDVCASAYFMPLLASIGSKLLSEASPKNAQPPSAP